MGQIQFLAMNLKDKEILEYDLLLTLYNILVEDLQLELAGDVETNTNKFAMIQDNTITLKANLKYKGKDFSLNLFKATYKDNSTVSVNIFYQNSIMVNNDINNVLYELKIGIKDNLLVFFKEVYWEKDTQNEEICKELYIKIHCIENQFRHLINSHMIAIQGVSWFKNVVHQKYISKANEFSQWYMKNKKYSDFKNVQTQLFNLQVNDLIEMLKDSYLNANEIVYKLQHNKDLFKGKMKDVLKEEYQKIFCYKSIWQTEFITTLGNDFEATWHGFSAMRNMIAHNKPICLELFTDIIFTINTLNAIFCKAEKQLAQRVKSIEEKEANHLYQNYVDDFYLEEAGLDGIPTRNEIFQRINENEEFANLLSLFEDYHDKLEYKIEELNSVIDNAINKLITNKMHLREMKSLLVILSEIVYLNSEEKSDRAKKYIQIINTKKGLQLIADEIIDDAEHIVEYLNTILEEIWYTSQISIDKIADFKTINNHIEIKVDGFLSLERGSSDNLSINIIEDGIVNRYVAGEVAISIGDYEFNDGGVAMPINEDGFYVDLDNIIDFAKKHINATLSLIENYINQLEECN